MSALDDLLALEGDHIEGRTESVRSGMTTRRARYAAANCELAVLRRDRDEAVAALHALVQVHHTEQRHRGVWSTCTDAACVDAQVALLERDHDHAKGST